MKNKWLVEKCVHPLNEVYNANFRILENEGVQFPICHFPSASSKKQPDTLLEKQERLAKLIVCAPEMLEVLEEWETLFYGEDIKAKGLIDKMYILFNKSNAILRRIEGIEEW